MDLSLLRSTSILNKYSLNAIPRDGDGGSSSGDSSSGDSWGGGSGYDSGWEAGFNAAFDSSNFDAGNFSSAFNAPSFDSGGLDGGSTFSGNNWGGGGGVSYGDAGLGPGGFGTGSFGFNGGAFDYGGGNSFTGLGPGGGGWDSGPWGAGTLGYDQGFGGLYSNPTMDAWGPGSYGAWAGFGEPSGSFNNFMGPFGDQSGWSMPFGGQYNQGYVDAPYGQNYFNDTFSPYAAFSVPGLGQVYGPYANSGYDIAPSLAGVTGINSSLLNTGQDPNDAQSAISHALYPNQSNYNPSAQGLYLDGLMQSGQLANPISQYSIEKGQDQFNPNNNPLGYPSSVWDASSYFSPANVTNQAQNSRDSFDSRYGEWGVPNAAPPVLTRGISGEFSDNFNSRYGDWPEAAAWGTPQSRFSFDVPPINNTPLMNFESPYSGPLAGPDVMAGGRAPALVPTAGDMQVAYDVLNGGPNAGPQFGLGGPLSGLVNTYDNPFTPGAANFDSRFGGPYAPSMQWTSDMYLGPDGRGDLRGPAATFDARFGDLPPAINGIPNSQEFARPTAQQELGDQISFGPGYVNSFNQAENYALTSPDMRTYSPGLIGGNLGYDLGTNFGVTGVNTGKSDALNNYVSTANQNLSPYEALQQALEARGGTNLTLDETGRSINDVMDAARAAQLNNQNMGREQNYPTLQEFLGDGRTATPSRGGYDVTPSRDGEVSTRGGRTDLSPDNSREAGRTAQTIVAAAARGENIQGYMNSLLAASRDPNSTQAQRTAALDALNGIISAVYGRGPNQSVGRGPYGGDPDPFIASQLRQGR